MSRIAVGIGMVLVVSLGLMASTQFLTTFSQGTGLGNGIGAFYARAPWLFIVLLGFILFGTAVSVIAAVFHRN